MIIKNVNVNKLHHELNEKGIQPYPVFKLKNGDGDFNFPEGTNMDLVQQIIDAHNPEPIPPEPTELELLQKKITELEQVIDTMLTGGTL